MAAEAGLDLTCLVDMTGDYSDDTECDIEYRYWGARLLRLAEFERRSHLRSRGRACLQRYCMIVILVLTLVVAIVSGAVGPWLQSQDNGKVVTLNF